MALELESIGKQAPAATGAPAPRAAPFSLASLTRPPVRDSDRLFFTDQLAILLEAGTSLYESLQVLRTQTANTSMRDVIGALLEDITNGKPFSQALEKHRSVFPPTYVKLIAASEAGGFMHEVLAELKAMEEKRDELKHTLVSALTYPLFLLAFSTAVVIFVLLVVFPQFGELFASIEDELPATTRFLMSVSDFLLNHGLYAAIALVACIVLAGRWLATPAGRAGVDRMILTLPGLRTVFGELYIVQFLRVLSLSLANGVPMMETLTAARAVVDNVAFKRLVQTIESSVEAGLGVATALEKASFVPPIAVSMLMTAERSGDLTRVSARVADYYEKALTRKLRTLSRLAEPVMLLVMGAVVGLLVTSLILPIFKLSRAVT